MLTNPSHLAYIILSPILSTALAFANLLTIYVFWRKFRLSSLSLIVMVNICACDIFVCLLSNTFYVANLIHTVHFWSTGAIACKLFKFLTMLTNEAQIFFLCILNGDRLRRLLNSSPKQWGKKHGLAFVSIGWVAATLLSLPRLALFDEKIRKVSQPHRNATDIIIYYCKPIGLDEQSYISITVVTFVLAYAFPACYIIYALIACQLYMWKRRTQIHISTMSNAVIKMHSKLAFTFNLTGALFMLVWTPFFVMSLLDLNKNLSQKDININFSLRCTLLILGSAKPAIYLIFLDKFRKCFTFKQTVGSRTDSGSNDGGRELKCTSTDANSTRVIDSKF